LTDLDNKIFKEAIGVFIDIALEEITNQMIKK